MTMEIDCCQFVQRCPKCQIHENLIHVPHLELHALTSPWPFLVWGINIIGKISPKSSNGHEFILVVIDYFTKWVEAASYARLTSSGVASFIISHTLSIAMESLMSRFQADEYISEQMLTLYYSGTISSITDRLRTCCRLMKR